MISFIKKKAKAFVSFTLCLAMMCTFFVGAFAAVQATFVIDTVTGASVGDVVSVALSIQESGTGIGALTVDFEYDASYLCPTTNPNSTRNDYFTLGSIANGFISSGNEEDMIFSIVGLNGLYQSGEVMIIYFEVINTIPAGEVASVCADIETIGHCEDDSVEYDWSVVSGGVQGADTDFNGTDVTFEINTVTNTQVGDIVSVDFSVMEENTGIGAMGVQFNYDSTYLRFVENPNTGLYFTAGSASGGASVVGNEQTMECYLATANGISQAGTVITLWFEVIQEIPAGETACISAYFMEAPMHFEDPAVTYNAVIIAGGVQGMDNPFNGVDVDFTIDTVAGFYGDVVPINLNVLQTQTGIGAMELQFHYDTNYLKFVENLESSRPQYFTAGPVAVEAGASVVGNEETMRMALATANGLYEAGAVVTLWFEIIREIPAGETAYIDAEFTSDLSHYEDADVTYNVSVTAGGVQLADHVGPVPSHPFDYYIEDGEAYIYQFNNAFGKTVITIPETLVGYPVVSVGGFAGEEILGVEFPQTVTNIVYAAFFNSCLQTVALPQNLTTIEGAAFSNCDNLQSVEIPASVTTIDPNAFGGCDSLTAITVEEGNEFFYSQQGVLFRNDGTLLQYPAGKPNAVYTVPAGVTAIADEAFIGNRLNGLIVPKEVTQIGENLFGGMMNCTLYGYEGSCAQTYALENGIDFIALADTVTLTDTAPVFSVDSATARAGEEFTVAVKVENNPGIVSARLGVVYNTACLELVGYEGADFGPLSYGPIENVPFYVNFMDSLNPNNTQNGAIVYLTFRVLENVPNGDYDISLIYTPDDVFDYDFNNVAFGVKNGVVTVVDHIDGDLNRDGLVDNKDYSLMERYLASWGVDIDTEAADVNGDGKINNKDFSTLQRYLNGWDITLK